jgi:rhamnosyltransferase
MLASIIIRTYNEAKHLPDLLQKIDTQKQSGIQHEVVVVDSGSTDETLVVARQFNARIVHIKKEEFTFGRSLNYGCEAAAGDYLVFVSGHCIPEKEDWLEQLVVPLQDDEIAYTYGRQIGKGESRFSECQLFKKYFPEVSSIPQKGFFCNNANAALKKEVWKQYPFDEALTGLEDMDLGRRLNNAGLLLAYVADAPVYHLHDESWHKVRMRFQREAIALRHIMPEVYVRPTDFLRFYISALLMDAGAALKGRMFWSRIGEISLFRLMQYWGSYRGNHEHRKLSERLREEYFYPK